MIVVAYLDPFSGGLILQALVAGFLTVTVTVRLYWRQLKAALGFAVPDEDDEEAPEDS